MPHQPAEEQTISAAVTTPPPRLTPGGTRGGFRVDIQALRALAVMLVVLNHLWPWHMPGGYVGVDVFFVISGFLITGHLTRELMSSGRIRFAAFYARRVRRLMPAALLVLAVSSIATLIWLPYSRWQGTAIEVLASAFYIENWTLAHYAVDYSAQSESASVAQHYWSLSVEEQFYLVWPLIMAGLFVLAIKLRAKPRAVTAVGLGALVGVGLVVSVVITELWPEQSYFVTPTRVWEFAAGGLLALVASRLRISPVVAALLGATGFALILVAARTFNAETAFPGWAAAVPVVGTALVIAAGTDRQPPLWNMLGFRPVQYVGAISYSLYLWHWPVIVIAPFALGHQLGTAERVAALGIAILAAGATKRFVEDPGQSWAYLRSSTRRTFLSLIGGMAVVALLAASLVWGASARDSAARDLAAAAADSPCYGPQAVAPGNDCADPFGPAVVPVMSTDNEYWAAPAHCITSSQALDEGRALPHASCDFSAGATDAPTVWLVGDSHAEHWKATVYALAETRGWVVKSTMLGGCPVADVAFVGYKAAATEQVVAECEQWSDDVTAAIVADAPSAVFTSSHARQQLVDDGSGTPPQDQLVAGLVRTWQAWAAVGSQVYVLADPPENESVRSADCAVVNAGSPDVCAVDLSLAQPVDPLVVAAGVAGPGVELIDLTDYMCDSARCYAVVGGVSVYYDANHLNREFAELLAPMAAAQLR